MVDRGKFSNVTGWNATEVSQGSAKLRDLLFEKRLRICPICLESAYHSVWHQFRGTPHLPDSFMPVVTYLRLLRRRHLDRQRLFPPQRAMDALRFLWPISRGSRAGSERSHRPQRSVGHACRSLWNAGQMVEGLCRCPRPDFGTRADRIPRPEGGPIFRGIPDRQFVRYPCANARVSGEFKRQVECVSVVRVGQSPWPHASGLPCKKFGL